MAIVGDKKSLATPIGGRTDNVDFDGDWMGALATVDGMDGEVVGLRRLTDANGYADVPSIIELRNGAIYSLQLKSSAIDDLVTGTWERLR